MSEARIVQLDEAPRHERILFMTKLFLVVAAAQRAADNFDSATVGLTNPEQGLVDALEELHSFKFSPPIPGTDDE